MALFDHYQFKVKFPGKQEFIIYPVNDEIIIRWTRDSDFRFFRWEMQTSLLIRNEPQRQSNGMPVLPFNDFADLELQQSCEPVELTIERRCKGEQEFTPFWHGMLARPEREYNVDDCEVTVKPRTDDAYTCLTEKWDQEQNIFNHAGDRIEVKTLVGSLEYIDCTAEYAPGQAVPTPYLDDCITGQQGWRVIYHSNEEIGGRIFANTRWVREVVNGGVNPPPGGGWIQEGLKWVRPVPVALRSRTGLDDQGPVSYQESWEPLTYTIDNGVLLKDIIQGFAASCLFDNYDPDNPKLISNFFGIAPDGTQPDNPAYTAALDHLQHVVVYQITDIARHQASYNASKGLLTFKKLLKDLKTTFNVDFYVDSDGVLRIEHESYFRKQKRMDLTQELWAKYLKGRGKFKFDKEKLPIKEEFSFPRSTRLVFDGVPIEYPPYCSDPDKTERYQVELFMTDLQFILQNPEEYEESPLFAMAATQELNGSYYFTQAVNPLTPDDPIFNGYLSWPALHENYHRHGRPQPKGFMNRAEETFLSFKFMKLQDTIDIPFGCCDIDEFEPEDLVLTQFGWCEIEDASYRLKAQKMELNLRF